MIDTVVDAVSAGLILAGSFFILVGGLGLVRMPDVYTRMHSASVTDTLGTALLFGGLMLQSGLSLVSLKLLFLILLFLFTTPLAAHALTQAALHQGVEPKLAEDRRNRLDKPKDDAPSGSGATPVRGGA
ncbi:MAG: monovalent cation/H(+) antiporter subunit G [Hyphomicrobiaceae bacterium]